VPPVGTSFAPLSGVLTLRRILCPVDLSDASRTALDHAIVLAQWYESRLSVLGVAAMPVALLPDEPAVVYELTPERRRRLLEALERFSTDARAAGIDVDVKLHEGDVVREILREARETAPDLLVIGTHGRGGFERFVLGSVAEKIVRKAECPVLTVPPGAAGHRVVMPGAYKTILYATDFSDAAEAALPRALSLAEEAGGRLLLVHVVRWPTEEDANGSDVLRGLLEDRMKEARQRLNDAVPADARDWCEAEPVVVRGEPAEQIVRLAEERSVDLIVMKVAPRGLVDLALNGAVAYPVLRAAPCPVLTLR
jgi:nucleotide-binding universal stress UspA family protein